MEIRRLHSITEIPSAQWDDLLGQDYPFLRHGFLAALEQSGSVSPATGWTPAHRVAIAADGTLQGLLPLYLKTHSYGEYVFDFQWAEALERAGRPYYPKLLAAIPFSPVQGPRLVCRNAAAQQTILTDLDMSLASGEVSSTHLLFNTGVENSALAEAGWIQRLGCQFHWHNRGYGCFDDFLAQCNSRKRKNFRKERLSIASAGITFRWVTGKTLTTDDWSRFYPFYAATYLKRGQHPYLSEAFFRLLGESMPESIRLLFAEHDGREVAAALFLVGGDTLYGRYWGSLEEYDRLHFETCFYQGMDRCIAEGLARFDAGAQGEHKLIRGFEPTITQSWHKLVPGLHEAVENFLERERPGVRAYAEEARSYLPFRQE
jgi:uncharacterized protein